MPPRTLTISCPRCLSEFPDVTVDQAEDILFHGCETCRAEGRTRPDEP